ncbi:hypothetical protein CC2G_013221 [Coprinopsis cinerea AmutBmut pab1-1]|nr:hypothetical protein CC2G_013221 [Coprinopsis cinerea AmutBmut pab1-1]
MASRRTEWRRSGIREKKEEVCCGLFPLASSSSSFCRADGVGPSGVAESKRRCTLIWKEESTSYRSCNVTVDSGVAIFLEVVESNSNKATFLGLCIRISLWERNRKA